MNTDNNVNDLNHLFKNDIKEPFFYNLNIGEIPDYPTLFEKIKEIFITGLLIHAGDIETKNINIEEVTKDNIIKIGKYMLSIGLKLKYIKVDPEEKDYIYKSFLYDIEKIEDLNIQVGMDWKTNYVNTIKLNVLNNNQETVKKIMDVTKNHTDANFFLKIQPPTVLKDYAIFVNKSDETHVFSFDFANIADYRTSGCKPKTMNGQSWQT